MNTEFLREAIKQKIVANQANGILAADLFDQFADEEGFESIFNQLKRDGILEIRRDNRLYFNFSFPYSFSAGDDFYGETQRLLALKGYRWRETIFNDNHGRCESIISVTRDADCFWSETYSCSALTTGWGRFNRFTCWDFVNNWIKEGGFEKEVLLRKT